MSKPDPSGGSERPKYRDEPVSEILAEMTGRAAAEFEAGDEYDYPHPNDLESVPEDDW